MLFLRIAWGILYSTIQYLLYDTILYYIIPYYTILYHIPYTILYSAIPYSMLFYQTLLYYTILYHTMLPSTKKTGSSFAGQGAEDQTSHCHQRVSSAPRTHTSALLLYCDTLYRIIRYRIMLYCTIPYI